MSTLRNTLSKALPSSLKKIIVFSAKRITPKLYWRPLYNSIKRNKNEIEINLLPFLCSPDKTSLDIGASNGLYTIHMLEFSRNCIAFEARPSQALILKNMLSAFTKKATVESVALSDKDGEAVLRILAKDLGRSTIESENKLEEDGGSERVDIRIRTCKLDNYNLRNVGFIKIDVEGHELAVLHGARETIAYSLPTLLIEIEERHKKNSIEDVKTYLKNYGYSGFFILNGKIVPQDEFDLSNHQNKNNVGDWTNNYSRKGVYINNFIFIPQHKLQEFTRESKSLVLL